MPYYRHTFSAALEHAEPGSERDKELAADPAWGRTADPDDAPPPEVPEPAPQAVVVADPEAT